MNALWILIIVAVVVSIYAIILHNRIIRYYNRVKQAWSDVITQERQKINILPKIEEVLGEYKEFEQSLQTSITELRNQAKKLDAHEAQPDGDRIEEIERAAKELMSKIQVSVEAYPDLKASQLYSQFMHEVSEQEANVGASIRIFNSNVAIFNTSIEVFPAVLINNLATKKSKIKSYENRDISVGFSPVLEE